jgi:hypothetical protein
MVDHREPRGTGGLDSAALLGQSPSLRYLMLSTRHDSYKATQADLRQRESCYHLFIMSRTEAQALAVCANGHFYPAYEFFAGAPGIEVTEARYTAGEDVPVPNCPKCGETGRILAGTFDFTENTIKLLQGPERTVEELERLAQILREAQESGASPEEVGNTVQREFPDWGPALARLLITKSPADLTGYITLIIAIIGAFLAYEQLEQAKNAEPDQIINNITVVQEAPPVPGQSQVAPTANPAYGKKIGRNKPCPCESGEKLKRCHGENGEKRYYGP